MKKRRNVRLWLVVMLGCACLLVSCSSETDASGGNGGSGGLTCDPGSTEDGGQCSPADASPGASGDASGTGGTSGLGGTSGSAGAGGGGGTGPVDPSGDCPKGLPGPTMVEVKTPGGPAYCIDSTEVTIEQYEAFRAVADVADASLRGPNCEQNGSFKPQNEGLNESECGPWVDDFDHGYPNWLQYPIHCVDWCDAYAFCKHAGKRLCGRRGGGASLTESELADPAKNEWFDACSAGGQHVYPYGDAYQEGMCFDEDHPDVYEPFHGMQAVATADGCRGSAPPFDAIYDMSGNVDEWIDACEPSGSHPYDRNCRAMGGSFQDGVADRGACAAFSKISGDSEVRGYGKGIRCCADPTQ